MHKLLRVASKETLELGPQKMSQREKSSHHPKLLTHIQVTTGSQDRASHLPMQQDVLAAEIKTCRSDRVVVPEHIRSRRKTQNHQCQDLGTAQVRVGLKSMRTNTFRLKTWAE